MRVNCASEGAKLRRECGMGRTVSLCAARAIKRRWASFQRGVLFFVRLGDIGARFDVVLKCCNYASKKSLDAPA